MSDRDALSSPARATPTTENQSSPESASDSPELVSLRARVAELRASCDHVWHRLVTRRRERDAARARVAALEAVLRAIPDLAVRGTHAKPLYDQACDIARAALVLVEEPRPAGGE